MAEQIAIPQSVEEVTPAWLRQVIPAATDARIVQVIHGTATKINAEIVLDGKPTSVWVKSGMEPHSQQDGLEVVYAGEVHYYQNYSAQYQTRTPDCLYAASDREGRSILVMADVTDQGGKFAELLEPATPEFAAKGLEYIARYQAASWMDPALAKDPWLLSGGSHNAYNLPKWLFTQERWDAYKSLPRFQFLPERLRDREALQQAHHTLIYDFFRKEPWALCHGDAHYGQAYQLPDGEVRLLDWQAVQIAHWSHDTAYFLIGALSVADRRSHEQDLLRRYLQHLGELGATGLPGWEEAWRHYSMSALHGLGWTFCPTEMQPEENCSAMAERYCMAVADLGSLELVQDYARSRVPA